MEELQRTASGIQGPAAAIVPTGSPSLTRVHRTRVELDLEAADERLSADLDVVAADDRLTDVVVFSSRDVLRHLHVLGKVHRRLEELPQVTALRLRSRLMVAEPAAVTDGVVAKIGSLNRLRVTRPLRVEVELPVLHPAELGDGLARVVRGLRRRGVSVYAVVPLLSFLNDREEQLLAITGGCRRIGVEVHHLVLAGHPLQAAWSAEHPVAVGRVVDLATVLRRHGSGRELPRLVVQTALGECDFGLTGIPLRRAEDGAVAFRLAAEVLDDLRELDPGWVPPAWVEIDDHGRPIVPVAGMTA